MFHGVPGSWQMNLALSGPVQRRVFHLYPRRGSMETHMPRFWLAAKTSRLEPPRPVESGEVTSSLKAK